MGVLNIEAAKRARDGNGDPAPRARLHIYASGKDTLCPIYQDAGLTLTTANPMIADANGFFAPCYLVDGAYRVSVVSERGADLFLADDVRVASPLDAGFAAGFASVGALLADEALSYAAAAGGHQIEVGAILHVAEGDFAYRVAAAGASDHHLATAGGLKLYALPGAAGISVSALGAAGDGQTDDTAAIHAAIAALGPDGGDVVFPRGQYRANVKITGAGNPHRNIRLVGADRHSGQGAGAGLVPFVGALPALQIGDDGVDTRDVCVEGLTLHGDGNQNQKGLLLLNAYRCKFSNIQINSFSDYNLRLSYSAGGQTAYVYFDKFSMGDSDGNCIEAVFGGSYTTAIYFVNGDIGDKAGGRALWSDGVHFRFVNTWFQLNDGAGVYLSNGAKLLGQNVILDSDAGTDVLLELDSNGSFTDAVFGSVTIDGRVKYLDGTTQDASGLPLGSFRAMHSYPFVQGKLAFADTNFTNAHEQDVYTDDVYMYWSGSNFDIKTEAESVRILPGSGIVENRAPTTGVYHRIRSDASGLYSDVMQDISGNLKLRPNTGKTMLGAAAVDRWFVDPATFAPNADNTYDIGYAGGRVQDIFAANGTIQTSDAREKQDVRALSRTERAVAKRLKKKIRAYRWKDAVAEKGDEARLHVGIVAQDVVAAFAAEGLDAHSYGILCHDAWEAEPEVTDEDGTIVTPARAGGERYGVRYEQLLAFIIAT